MIQTYEGVIYRENLEKSPFRKVIEKLFAVRKKYKDGKSDLMQGLVKLITNSLHGVQIRRDNNELYKCKSETWMQTEYDENDLDSWKQPNDKYFVKLKEDEGINDGRDNKKTLPAHLGAFISGTGKRIMNNFIREIKGFYYNSIYYGDSDGL